MSGPKYPGEPRCEAINDAGERCIYGAGHRIAHHCAGEGLVTWPKDPAAELREWIIERGRYAEFEPRELGLFDALVRERDDARADIRRVVEANDAFHRALDANDSARSNEAFGKRMKAIEALRKHLPGAQS